MKVFVILTALLAAASATGVANNKFKSCMTNGEQFCKADSSVKSLSHCSAKYGYLNSIKSNLDKYVHTLIGRSFDYLLLSMQFGTFLDNREGFQAYFRKLSDQAWNDAIDLMKYMTKRGANVEFQNNVIKVDQYLHLGELKSFTKAMDIEKELAEEALRIYEKAMKHIDHAQNPHIDGPAVHYLEEKFLEPQSDRVRNLAGHINDLKQLVSYSNPSINLFIFDDYLKKSL